MIQTDRGLRLSASDLVGFLNCRHLTQLDVHVARGSLAKPTGWDPFRELLAQRGDLHEKAYVAYLEAAGGTVVRIDTTPGQLPEQAAQTLVAMRAGASVIVQGVLVGGQWTGRTDVLRRVPAPSALGDWSYEIIDTKLAQETKGATILQLSLYSDLLAEVQGRLPDLMGVVVPGSDFVPEWYRTRAYAAYYRSVRRGLEQMLRMQVPVQTYPEPCEHCEMCRWRGECDSRRRQDDHLSLVAGISRQQIHELEGRQVDTLAALAEVALPLPWKSERGLAQSYGRIREQARLQAQGRRECRPIFETIALEADVGLARLPAPSLGDVFFDIEGDPFVDGGGLEYLFGYTYSDESAEETYVGLWAPDQATEKRVFEAFVDFILARWARYPDLHIYHYAPYEPSALKRLMGRHATREEEVDRILRGQLFVDLYAVVRQGIRASVERYSIKDLEPFYAFERRTALADARRALFAVQAGLELGDSEAFTPEDCQVVAGYNREDCISARELRNWLEGIRARLVSGGDAVARPTPPTLKPLEELKARQQRIADLVVQLTNNVPADVADRTADQHARWILAYTLDWHRRELKSAYWEFFRLGDLTADELTDERAAVGGLEFVGAVASTGKTPVHRYRFPLQETDWRGEEELYTAGGDRYGEVVSVSLEARTVDIKKRKDTADVHAAAAFASTILRMDKQADALLRLGEYVALRGLEGEGAYQAARDLLRRQPPLLMRQLHRAQGETASEWAVRSAAQLMPGVLAIQGPPGAGKTYTAARMICELVSAGKTVGVTANSHAVIRNLLDGVVVVADERALGLRCVQKTDDPGTPSSRIAIAKTNDELFAELGAECSVGAGTSWLWARDEAGDTVDVLFVDEAGQMSLANVLAVSQACRTLVLLGDPQQLEQPIKGSHPDGTGLSALEYLLDGHPTIPAERGLFLEETWRLHPSICAFTSEVFYEGRLKSRAGLEHQRIDCTGCLHGSGLRYVPVEHVGNRNCSTEEGRVIRDLVEVLLGSAATWTNRRGETQALTREDILVIAPYNAQVFELQRLLPNTRVGTVDKFQGQEAPVVFYSMTSSSPADAPRGMEFLYNLNRLNVATSRARCLCVLVGTPSLFEPDCRTPRQMGMANAFCSYLEAAHIVQP